MKDNISVFTSKAQSNVQVAKDFLTSALGKIEELNITGVTLILVSDDGLVHVDTMANKVITSAGALTVAEIALSPLVHIGGIQMAKKLLLGDKPNE